jgi:hypothetical protein
MFPAHYANIWAEIATQLTTYPKVPAEPPLQEYARAH